MATETEHLSHQTELAATVRLVAGFWLNEMDQNGLQLFQDPGIKRAWIELGGSVLDGEADPSETLDRLAADYCQLLIGPKNHLPPVQSVWVDHIFQSRATSSTDRYYALYADYLPPGTLHDHLGCQLHFVAFLLDEASRSGESTKSAMQVLAQFQEEHLQWSQQLLDRVVQKADTDFYRGLAVVTGQLIKELAH